MLTLLPGMKLSGLVLCLAITAPLVSSCGKETPTSPSSDYDLPTTVEVRCPEFGESSRCNAYGETGQDVSGLVGWSTSDPTVATVSSTGLVTVHRTGEVSIRASYRGGIGFRIVWAVAGNGLHGTYRWLQGQVGSMNGALAGVELLILNGPNAGRTTTTFASGHFVMSDLQDGQFTIRLSKPGYRTAEYVWWIPGGNQRYPTLSVAP
jgi:hypothetical protein